MATENITGGLSRDQVLSPVNRSILLGRKWWSLRLIIALLFVQIWHDIAGFTLRLEDLLWLMMIGWWLFYSVRSGVFHYYRSRLNLPILFWMAAIGLGILVSFTHELPPIAQKDALVNGVRLILAVSSFFVIYNHPLAVERKIQYLFSTILIVSFVTTFIALLQIIYWEGWLPFSLPAFLITFKEGANMDPGREIFALFIGNSGTHTWSSMLAMQAICVWLIAQGQKRPILRLGGYVYFLVLGLILVRTSVRTSILGLGLSIFTIVLLQGIRSQFPFNRVIKPVLLLTGITLIVVFVLVLAPQSYFLDRISQTIPQLSSKGVVINRASNIYGRLEYSANAFRIFLAYPFAGGGFGSYQTLSGTIGTISIIHAHNSFSQTFAELGLIGVSALMWLLWAIFRSLRVSPPHHGVSIAKLQLWYLNIGAMTFIVFSALFTNAFWDPNQVAFRMIILGILLHVHRGSWA